VVPIVLVHGGGLDSRCWEPLQAQLAGPSLAVDLPGRGVHPAPLASVTFASCADSVRADIDAARYEDVVLVGHSLAGCSMPATIGVLGERVRHAVFVACTVPPDGQSAFDTLDPEIQAYADANAGGAGDVEPRPMAPEIAKLVLGSDLTDEQFAWCAERLVAEAPRLTTDPVDLAPLRTNMPRTWVRTLHDIIVSADKQQRFAENVGDCPVVDLDSGHMCMVNHPEELAQILDEIAARDD
jgi:pimeloyl-ACP methyl ester carboxylesterase